MTASERESAIAQLLPLVERIARGLMRVHGGLGYDDCYQDGCIGLIRAVDTYDPAVGVTLRQFAKPLIARGIFNGLRERDAIPDRSRATLRDAERERHRLAQERQEFPGTSEMLSRVVGLARAMLVAYRADAMSLDARLPPGEHISPDWSDDPAGIVERTETHRAVRVAVDRLTERQRAVLRLHYYARSTTGAISRDMRISTQRVSQLHLQALQNVRKALASR